MGDRTKIEWTEATWNPTRGCSRVSEGCRNCYAERIAARFSGGPTVEGGLVALREVGPYNGFAESTASGARWTGRVELILSQIDLPLRWRKPRRVFVDSMSDLFHEKLADEEIDHVIAVTQLAWWHTYLILTKRAGRMRDYFSRTRGPDNVLARVLDAAKKIPLPRGYVHRDGFGWPYSNLWLGVSVEDQVCADERIPHLLATPAAVRFVSAEPLLGPVDFSRWLFEDYSMPQNSGPLPGTTPRLDWLIVGGESGSGARPMQIEWARSTIAQCRATRTACFVKQLGARPFAVEGAGVSQAWSPNGREGVGCMDDCGQIHLRDRKGGDPSEWSEDLRVREYPRRSSDG